MGKHELNKFLYILFFIQITVFTQESQSVKDSVVTNEIEVISNRLKTTKLFSPNKIQLIDEEKLLGLNGSKLSDALSFSDGVYIKNYGFNSGLKTISLNSAQSEHTIILLDGVKLNKNDNAQYDVSLLNMDNISRIEISKGGSSALYGSEAIGGVVNIISKSPMVSRKPVLNLSGELGSYGNKKIFVGLSQGVANKVAYGVSYSNESSDNKYEYYFFNGFSQVLKQRLNSDYLNHAVNLNLSSKLSHKSQIIFSANYNYWNRSIPGVESGTRPSTAKQIDRDLISTISLISNLSKQLDLKTNITYKYSLLSYYDTATYHSNYLINSFYKLNTYSNNTSFDYLFNRIPLSLNFGYDLSYSKINSNETEDGKVFNSALFIAGKYNYEKIITIYPSFRYDYYSNIDNKNVLTGKFGVNIKPFHKIDLSIKSSIGNNFRAPTFNELYWKDLGNKNLKPERSVSFDGGLYYKFKLLGINEFEVSYFNSHTTDRIIWTPGSDNLWRPINIGKVKSEGIDVSVNSAIKIIKSVNVNLGFNYNNASAKNNDNNSVNYNKQLIYIPKEFFKSSIGVKYSTSSNLIKFVFLNAFYTYTGKRFNNAENSSFVKSFDLLDGNIGCELSIFKVNADIKFSVNNITNENYQVVSGYPMPLRNYNFQISLKY